MTDDEKLFAATTAAYSGLIAGDGTHHNDAKAAIRMGERLIDELEKPQTLAMNATLAMSRNGHAK